MTSGESDTTGCGEVVHVTTHSPFAPHHLSPSPSGGAVPTCRTSQIDAAKWTGSSLRFLYISCFLVLLLKSF